MSKYIWVTWEDQVRNRSVSSYLGVEIFEFKYDDKNKIYRYFLSAFKTLFLFLKFNPKVIFVQNPSVALSLLAVVTSKILHSNVFVDAHNVVFESMGPKFKFASKVNKWIIRNADAVIVTNEVLKKRVEEIGGTGVVIPDPLPDLFIKENSTVNEYKKLLNDGICCLCITSWSEDEPYENLLRAAESYQNEITFLFSGNYNKIGDQILNDLPSNVKLLGFVSRDLYENLLFEVDFVVDLTTRDNCLVCGAYEAVSAGKPMLISNSCALKEYFYKGAIYTGSEATEIAKNILLLISDLDRLKISVLELRSEIKSLEEKKRKKLLNTFKIV